jgi:hypothetical protein
MKFREFLDYLISVNFPRRTLLHGASKYVTVCVDFVCMVMSVWQLNVFRRKCPVDDPISLKDVGAIVIKSSDCLYCCTSVVYVCM